MDAPTLLVLIVTALLTQALVRGVRVEVGLVDAATVGERIGPWTCLYCRHDFHTIRYDVRLDAHHGGRCPHCGEVIEPKDVVLGKRIAGRLFTETALLDVLVPFWSPDCYTPEETGMAVEQTIGELTWMIQALRYTLRRHYDYYEMESCQCMEAPCVHTLADYVLAFTDITDLDEARSAVQSSDLYVDVYEDKDAQFTGYNAPDWITVELVAHDDSGHRIGTDDALATVYLETDDTGAVISATAPGWITVQFHTVEETDGVPA